MEVKIETMMAAYDEELKRLTKENILLRAQLKQIEINAQNNESNKLVKEDNHELGNNI